MQTNKKSNLPLAFAIALVLVVFAAIFGSCNKGGCGSSKEYKCGYCGRTFEAGSDDAHSIARTHLCESCNESREWGNAALGRD